MVTKREWHQLVLKCHWEKVTCRKVNGATYCRFYASGGKVEAMWEKLAVAKALSESQFIKCLQNREG